MPDTASFADLIDEIKWAVALEESERDIREERVSSQDEVRERMRRRFGGNS
jgi:hypothetical protein